MKLTLPKIYKKFIIEKTQFYRLEGEYQMIYENSEITPNYENNEYEIISPITPISGEYILKFYEKSGKLKKFYDVYGFQNLKFEIIDFSPILLKYPSKNI